MKLFKRLTFILIMFLSIGLLCACESAGNQAPAPTNLRCEETKILWDSPSPEEKLSFEITYTLDGKSYSKIVIGTSYNFKDVEIESINYTIQTFFNIYSFIITGLIYCNKSFSVF